ncbi:MAG: hypothetical protein ACRCR2_02315 [Fusobacteriaceae bacterium]
MAITWRNIGSADFGTSVSAFNTAGNSFDKAISSLQGIAQDQRDMNIFGEQKERGENTQAAIEALKAAAPDMESYKALEFDKTVNPFGQNIDRAAVFKYYEQLDDDLMKNQKDAIGLEKDRVDLERGKIGIEGDKLANEAKRLGMKATKQGMAHAAKRMAREDQQYKDSQDLNAATAQLTSYLAKGGNMEDAKEKLIPDLLTNLSATGVASFNQLASNLDKSMQDMTVRQKEDLGYLNQATKLEYDNTIAKLNAEESTVMEQYPVDKGLTPINETKTLSDTMAYATKVAPPEGVFSLNTEGGSGGKKLQKRIQDVFDQVNERMKAADKIGNYELPVQAIQMAVESMPVTEGKEMDTSLLMQRTLEYATRMRKSELNAQKQAELRGDISRRRKEADERFLDTIKGNPEAIRNLKR